MTEWSSGDSVSPANLNTKTASATSSTGFSCNTFTTESGNTVYYNAGRNQFYNQVHFSSSTDTTGDRVKLNDFAGLNGRGLELSAVDQDQSCSLQIVPGSNRTDLSGVNSQILIFGMTDGAGNWERFAITYNNGQWFFTASNNGTGELRPMGFYMGDDLYLSIESTGNVVTGKVALDASDTTGHFHIPSYAAAGDPTGSVQTEGTGDCPIIYNRTSNSLHVYDGSWSGVSLS